MIKSKSCRNDNDIIDCDMINRYMIEDFNKVVILIDGCK